MRTASVVLSMVMGVVGLAAVAARGEVLTVPAQYATVQEAIDAATDGDEVVVSPGRYVENLQMSGRNIILRSTDPTSATVVSQTILDGNKSGSVVTFGGTEQADCILTGFTITNGSAHDGGGILGYSTRATISGNRIEGNVASFKGGGIYKVCGATRDNWIAENTAGFGGGLSNCYGVMERNRIHRNRASYGSALSDCDGYVENNLIDNNVAGYSSIVYGGRALLRHNTLSANRVANPGSSPALQGSVEGDSLNSVSPCLFYGRVENCIIWGNSGTTIYTITNPTGCCIENWTDGGTSTITVNPRFVDAANGDFRLDETSPCIDAAVASSIDSSWDVAGAARNDDAYSVNLSNSDSDIGAYEFTGTVSLGPPPAPPSDLSPPYGASDVSLWPVLRCGEFHDSDTTPTHLATQWQFDDEPDFSSPWLDTGLDTERLREFDPAIRLDTDTTYWWRVRFLNNQHVWSDWSTAAIHTYPQAIHQVPAAYATIQSAIDAAREGDAVVVSPGVYRESLTFRGTNIVLRSTDPTSPTVVRQTIINGDGNRPVVMFKGTEIPVCVLEGFTLTNGQGSYSSNPIPGFGIAGRRTHATIRNNSIVGNKGYTIGDINGGGIAQCDGAILNNEIAENTKAFIGGGLYDCNGLIEGNRIHGNRARFGAGVGACMGITRNNLIYDNFAEDSGGGMQDCQGTIENNTIYGNAAAFFAGGLNNCGGTIRNCIVYGNTAGYGGSQLVTWTESVACCVEGYSGSDPQSFSINPRLADPENGDFRLTAYSPCIDAGIALASPAATDFAGNPRVYDAKRPNLRDSDIDMGAYEFAGISPGTGRPRTPVPVFPSFGADDIVARPWLVGGPFSDYPGEDFLAAQWQIDDDPDFSSPHFDSGIVCDSLTTLTLPLPRLERNTVYHWRLRHLDNSHTWSDWGIARFTTTARLYIRVPVDYPTIQRAIDMAEDGQEIVVSPGIYLENIDFLKKEIVLRSVDPLDPAVVESTILDGNRSGPVVSLGYCNGNATIMGFTIRNGLARFGGGIDSQATGKAQILHNRIVHNEAEERGGGIYGSNGLVEWNTVAWNTAPYGGGIASCQGLPVRNNRVVGNKATWKGGGLYDCWQVENNVVQDNESGYQGGGVHSSNDIIRGNLIIGNSAGESGGGIFYSCMAHSPEWPCIVEGNTIYGNQAKFGGGATGGMSLRNCIIWGNRSGSSPQIADLGWASPQYESCNIEGWGGGGTRVTSFDPQFVDPNNGDFHLQPTSPCIDSGIQPYGFSTDLDGNPAPYDAYPVNLNGTDFDMGAFEYVGAAPEGTPPAKPSAIQPANGDTETPRTPTLTSSPFVPGEPEADHLATQWQLVADPATTATLVDSGIVDAATTRSQSLLMGDFSYWWRVRYLDGRRSWSPWSEYSLFTTRNPIVIPEDFSTIQEAIDTAFVGDEIVLLPGTYHERIAFNGKNLVLRSINPDNWSVVKATIITADWTGSAITLGGAETEECVIKGLTITGACEPHPFSQMGWTSYGTRAGIESKGSRARILHNMIRENVSYAEADVPYGITRIEARGGGISGHAGPIVGNIFQDNILFDDYAEGYMSFPTNGEISVYAVAEGGGLFRCSGPIINNVFLNNGTIIRYPQYAWPDRGAAMVDCTGPILFNTLHGNSGGILNPTTSPSDEIRNNIIWESGKPLSTTAIPEFCCIQDFPTTSTGNLGNIALDPRLADPGRGEFHLLPDSPCIDAGGFVAGLDTDFDGDPRPLLTVSEPRGDGSSFDIGADEFSLLPPELVPLKILGRLSAIDGTDLNGDGVLDIADWITYLCGANP